MQSLTNQSVIDRIDVIEKKLPNGEIQKIKDNTKEIKDYLIKVTKQW